MKLFKYGLPFAALALLASCSNDNLGEPTPGNNGTTPVEGEGAYININLAVPTSGSTRSEQDVYDDGDESEYAVKNATLYIFKNDETIKGPGECIAIIPIDKYFGWDIDADDTSNPKPEITGVKKIEGLNVTDYPLEQNEDGTYKDHWALVILNKGGLNGAEPTYTSVSNTYNEFSKWEKKVIDYGTSATPMMEDGKYFTMTNALGWEGTGPTSATDKPTICAKITNNHIYLEGHKDASKKDLNIYVQRGVAKVSVTGTIKIGDWSEVGSHEQLTDKEGNVISKAGKDWIYLTGWALDNTNKKSYPSQTLNAARTSTWYDGESDIHIQDWSTALTATPMSRFVKLGNTATSNYTRFFWGVDPNYDVEENDISFNKNSVTPVEFTTNAALYCLENTFSVDSMTQRQTTRVLLEGYYYALNEGDDGPAGNVGTPFISRNGAHVVPNEKLGLLTEKFTEENKYTAPFNTIFPEYSFTAPAQVTVEGTQTNWSELTPDQQKQYQDKDKAAWAAAMDAVLKALNLPIGSDEPVCYHPEGKVYYSVLIRHFDDDDFDYATNDSSLGTSMKWDDEAEALLQFNEKYPTDKDSYLIGRYGVVRNNWYELNLRSVKAVGTPYIPDVIDQIDDEPGGMLLDVKLRINKWVKRNQGVQFGQ